MEDQFKLIQDLQIDDTTAEDVINDFITLLGNIHPNSFKLYSNLVLDIVQSHFNMKKLIYDKSTDTDLLREQFDLRENSLDRLVKVLKKSVKGATNDPQP